MAKWTFYFSDNGGKKQSFVVTAKSKPEAIEKGMKKAQKNAKGDCIRWDCSLKSV